MCTKIKWLNSLTMSPIEVSTVATYPSTRGQVRLKGASSKKGKDEGVATNVYSRKTLEKPRKGSTNFKNKGSGVVYVRGRY